MLRTIATGTIKMVSTIGLNMPGDFPKAEYESLHKHVITRNGKSKIDGTVLDQFRGGWNAVAYRFRAMAEHDDSFVKAIKEAAGNQTMENRYVQERELFGFFVTGLSVIESIGYATFAISSIISAADFSMQTDRQKRAVTPEALASKLTSFCPHESISNTWNGFLQKAEFTEWKKIRNTLAHRTSPPRLVTNSASIDFQTGETSATAVTAEWKDFGIPIDSTTTSKRRNWLAESTKEMLTAANTFAANHL
jgi:hypothetical protein